LRCPGFPVRRFCSSGVAGLGIVQRVALFCFEVQVFE
jgi:hypothetical protein